jgi:hypothetical protein
MAVSLVRRGERRIAIKEVASLRSSCKSIFVNCPHCHKPIPNAVDVRSIGSKGGKVKGPSKARTTDQARAAVEARWAKYRAKQKAKPTD